MIEEEINIISEISLMRFRGQDQEEVEIGLWRKRGRIDNKYVQVDHQSSAGHGQKRPKTTKGVTKGA